MLEIKGVVVGAIYCAVIPLKQAICAALNIYQMTRCRAIRKVCCNLTTDSLEFWLFPTGVFKVFMSADLAVGLPTLTSTPKATGEGIELSQARTNMMEQQDGKKIYVDTVMQRKSTLCSKVLFTKH